jgi:hypothetical protein
MTPKYAKLTSWCIRVAVGAGLAGVVCELSGVTSPVVTVLVLIFIAVAPAAAFAGLLRGFDPFARLVLACVTAIVAVALIAMVMLAAGLWSPKGGLVVIAVISAAALLVQRRAAIRASMAGRAESWRRALINYWAGFRRQRAFRWAAKPAEVSQAQPSDDSALLAERGGQAETAESDASNGTGGPGHHRVTADDTAAAELPSVRDHA